MNGRFSLDPGKHDKMECDVCGQSMEVRRNVMGATGFAEAMARRAHLHDSFTCKDIQKDWHIKASKIIDESRETSSERLRKILLDEVADILTEAISGTYPGSPVEENPHRGFGFA